MNLRQLLGLCPGLRGSTRTRQCTRSLPSSYSRCTKRSNSDLAQVVQPVTSNKQGGMPRTGTLNRDTSVKQKRPEWERSQRSDRSRHDYKESEGTMTLREKEIFTKVLLSIKRQQPSSDTRENTISFDGDYRDEGILERSSSVGIESLQAEDIEAYPPALQKEIADAQFLVKTNQERKESLRGRYSAFYNKHKEYLYGETDMSKIMEFVDSKLFGPFQRGEIVLERPTPEMLEFCRAYPILVADVMCILRLSFRDLSSSEAIFQRMKRVGIESRALGGTAAVYNEALLTRFEGWHDLGMVEDVLKEMEQDAIQADVHTLAILKYMSTTIIQEREASEAGNAYWSVTRPQRLEALSRRIAQVDQALRNHDG